MHRAALRDGREVAVKIQRPNIREQVLKDMDTMGEVAAFLDKHSDTGRRIGLKRMIDDLKRSLLLELDDRLEAQNMVTIGKNLEKFPRIVVPQPVQGYSTARVLTMDYISGQKITAVSPLVLAEAAPRELAEELFRAYLHQVILDGLFHADPHPGNVLLTDDKRIALLDSAWSAACPPIGRRRSCSSCSPWRTAAPTRRPILRCNGRAPGRLRRAVVPPAV